MKTIEEIINEYEPKTISVTFNKMDVFTLYMVIANDLDESGIANHILAELGVDFWPEVGV